MSKMTQQKPGCQQLVYVNASSDSDDAEENETTTVDASIPVELMDDDSAKVQQLTEKVIYLEKEVQFEKLI